MITLTILAVTLIIFIAVIGAAYLLLKALLIGSIPILVLLLDVALAVAVVYLLVRLIKILK